MKPHDDESIGNGGARSASAVAGGSRRRAGALGSDAQNAQRVHRCDRAPARADRGNRHGRQIDRELADHLADAVLRLAVTNDGHVGAGSADIEAHGVRESPTVAPHSWRR